MPFRAAAVVVLAAVTCMVRLPQLAIDAREATRFVRVTVQDLEGTPLDGAMVSRIGGDQDSTGTTGLPGRVAFRLSSSNGFVMRVSRPGFVDALLEAEPQGGKRVTDVVVNLVPIQAATRFTCGASALSANQWAIVPALFNQAQNTITP